MDIEGEGVPIEGAAEKIIKPPKKAHVNISYVAPFYGENPKISRKNGVA